MGLQMRTFDAVGDIFSWSGTSRAYGDRVPVPARATCHRSAEDAPDRAKCPQPHGELRSRQRGKGPLGRVDGVAAQADAAVRPELFIAVRWTGQNLALGAGVSPAAR